MYVIVGLGNPGKQYENTRHNIGFISIDYLAEQLGVKVNKAKHKALIGECRIGREKVVLVKPQTFMNLSGESVREIIEYYKIPIENLIVIYDDIDIDRGAVRIRSKGSAGTHNGMRSIIKLIGSDKFPRVRIGIGKDSKIPLVDYVIGNFRKDEVKIMEEAVMKAVSGAEAIITEGIDKAMSKYNVSN